MKSAFVRAIIRIVLPYILFAGMWVLLSNRLLEIVISDASVRAQWSSYKAWAFVIVSTLLLAALLRFEICGRKRDEQMCRIQSLLLAVTEGTPDAVYVKDTRGRYLLFNAGACRIVGKSREEVLGKDDKALFSLDDAEKIMEGDQRVLASGFSQTYEEAISLGGKVHTFLSSKGPVRDPQGHVIGLFGVAHDITERQRSARELHRVNRALRTVSECNQALIHATKEDELLEKLCRMMVERGGYRLAWVGFAEQDESKTVLPAAQAGFEEGYLATANVTWADNERGHGPVGTAIRTGNSCVIRNILQDATFAPWRDDAVRRGYASVVAFPLVAQGNVFGALTIYAATPDAFDAEEVSLLAELAADLAYGIATLRLREEHAHAELALHESERKYRELVEHANSIILRWNSEGQITFLNEYGQRFFGYSSEEILGRHVMDTIVPPTESGGRDLKRLMEQICADPKSFEQSINENVRRNGERVWITWTNKIVLDEQGHVKEILSIGSDITERRRSQTAIQRERDFSDAVLNSLPGAFYCFDEQLRFRRWNKNFERVTGYSDSEIARLIPLDLFAGADKSLVEARIKEVFDKGSGDVEADFVAKDGSRTAYYFTGTAIDVGGQPHLVGVGIDISARKHAEIALRERTRQLQLALQVAQMGVWQWNISLDTISTIQGGGPMSGLPEGVYPKTGKAFYALVHPEDRLRTTECLQRASETGTYQAEFRMQLPDQSVRWVFAQGQCPRNDAGQSAMMIGVDLDITERKKAEQEVRQLHEDLQRYARELEDRVRLRTAQLESSNKELEAFSYSVSHDLRAPLRGIDGWSHILHDDCGSQLDVGGRECLDHIFHETKRMGQLIDDMLQLARVSRVEMRPVRVDLTALVQSISVRIQAMQTNRQIEFKIQAGVAAYGDPQLLDVVLTNLLENACKFTGKRAHARIDFGTARELSAENTTETTIYYVRDNGAGFDMARAGKLFGTFQRMHTTAEFPGTGVGLATVQRIVQRHGGRVWAQSQVDQGATFFFTLSAPDPV